MKLHLPSRLRKALLACLASLVVPAFSLTVSSGSALVGSATLVSFFLGQHAQAEVENWDEDEIIDADSKTAEDLEVEEGHGYKKIGAGTLTITEGVLDMPIWVHEGGFTLSNGVSATGDIFVESGGTLTLNGNTLGNVTFDGGTISLSGTSTFQNLTINNIANTRGNSAWGAIDVQDTLTVEAGRIAFFTGSIATLAGAGDYYVAANVSIGGGSIGRLYIMWGDTSLTLTGDLEVTEKLGAYVGSGGHQSLISSNGSHLILSFNTEKSSYAEFLKLYTNTSSGGPSSEGNGAKFTNTFTAGVGIGGEQSATFTENNTTWDHSFIITSGATLTVEGNGGFTMGSGTTLTVGNAGILNLNTTLDLTQGANLVVNTEGAANVGTGGVLKASSSSSITGVITLTGGTLEITEGTVSLDALKITGEGSAITIGLTGSASLNLTSFKMEGSEYGLSLKLEGLTSGMQNYQLFDETTWSLLKEYEERITFIWNNMLITDVAINEDGTLNLDIKEQGELAEEDSTLVWAGSEPDSDGIWASEDPDEEWHVEGEAYSYANGHGYSVVFGEGSGLITSISLRGDVSVVDMRVEGDYSFTISTSDTSSASLTVTGILTVADEATFTGNSDLSVATLAGSGTLNIEGVNATITTSGSDFGGYITVDGGSLTLDSGVTLGESSSIEVTDGSLTLNGNTLGDVKINAGATVNSLRGVTFHDLSILGSSFSSDTNVGVITVNGTLTVADSLTLFVAQGSTINKLSGSGTLKFEGPNVTITNGGTIGKLEMMWGNATVIIGADLEVGGFTGQWDGSTGNNQQHLLVADGVDKPVHTILTSVSNPGNISSPESLDQFLLLYGYRYHSAGNGYRDSFDIQTGIGFSGLSLTFAVGSASSASETWSNDFIVKSSTSTNGSLTINGASGVEGANFAMASGKTLTVGENASLTLNALLDMSSTGSLSMKEGSTLYLGATGSIKVREALSLYTLEATQGSSLFLSSLDILSASTALISIGTEASGTLTLDLTGLTLDEKEGEYKLFGGDGNYSGLSLLVSGYDTSIWDIRYNSGMLTIGKLPSELFWSNDTDGTWSADTSQDWAAADGGAGTYAFRSGVDVTFGAAGNHRDGITVSGDIEVGNMTVGAGYTFTAATTGGSITVTEDLNVSSGILTLNNISTTVEGTITAGSGSSVGLKLGNGTTLRLEQGGSIGKLDYSDVGDRTISLGDDLSIAYLNGSQGADRILRFANIQGSEVEKDDFVTVTITGGTAVPSTSLFFGKGVNVDFRWTPSGEIANSCTWTIEENISFSTELKVGTDSTGGGLIVRKDMESQGALTVKNASSSIEIGGDLSLGGALTMTISAGTVFVGGDLTVAGDGLKANGGTITIVGEITEGNSVSVDGGTLVLNSDITVTTMGGGTFKRYGIDDDPELDAITVNIRPSYNWANTKNMTFGKGVIANFTGAFTKDPYQGTLTAEENVTLNGNMTVSTGTINVGGDLTFNSGDLTLNNTGSISVDGALTLTNGNLTLSNGTLTLGGGAGIKGTATLNSEVRLNGGVLNVAGELSGSSNLYVNIAKGSTAQLSFATFGDSTSIQLGFDAAALEALVGTEGYQLFTEGNWQSDWEEYFDLYTLNRGFGQDDYEISITDKGVLKIVNLNDLVYTWAGTDGTWGEASADEEWNCGTGGMRAWQQVHDVRFVGAEGLSREITLSGDIEVKKMTVVSGEYTFTVNEGDAGLSGTELAIDAAGTASFTGADAVGEVVSFGSLTGGGSLTVSGSAVAVEDADGFDGAVTVSGGVLSLNGVDGLGLTGDITVEGGELSLTTTAGSMALGAVEVSGGELKLNAGGRVDSLAMDGGKVSITGAQSTEIGAVEATGGTLEVAPTGAVALGALVKKGAGTLALSGGAVTMDGGISIDSAGRVDATAAASLDISGGLSFILGGAQNSLDTAYLHGLGGNIVAAHAPADGIGLSITGALTSGIYYLVSGLDTALTLDNFNCDGALDALLDELSQTGEEGSDWDLALDLTDGVLSLNVVYIEPEQWVWDGSQNGNNVWSDNSNDNWNQNEGNTGTDSPQVYFYSNGAGEIVVAGTVTPGAMVVRGGHYIFTHMGSEGGIDLQGGVGANSDNADGEARLIIGGDLTEAHVELNLQNKNIPLVNLLENGKLTIGHKGAVNDDAIITMDGGMLAIGEGDNGALILSELGKMKLTLENGSALRLQVGKSYAEFDSADEYLGVAAVAMYAARDTGTQTFTLMGADVVKEALTNGIDKTGRRALVVLVGKDDLQGGAVTGAFAAQEGTLALVYSGAAEMAATATLSVTAGATLRLETTGAEQLKLKSSFTHVAASADLEKMLGAGAAARVELVGNVALDAAANNSAYAGVMALEGAVAADSGAALGGTGTELELNGGTLTLGKGVQEVSVGMIHVAGVEAITQGAQQATLKAKQLTGAGTLATAAGDTLTLEADMAGYAGTLQANKAGWTLAGKQSSDTLGMSLSGEGKIVFSEALVGTGSSIILTGTIGSAGSATSLANEMKTTKLVIAGDGSGSTGSLSGDTLLGSASYAGSWGGAALEAGATLTLVNGALSGKDFTKGEGAALLATVERGCAVDVNGMDGANFDGIAVKASGQLQNVSGTITAGGKEGITVSLLFGADNVGNSDGGDYLITGDGKLLVEDAAGLKLDFTNESFYKLLTDHREEGVESRLLIYEGGSITFGGATAEAEASGMLSSVLMASNLGKLLYDLGFNATASGGDLILTGTSADVYLVMEDNEEVGNSSSVDGWYQGLGGHKATVVDGTLDVTAGDMAAEAEDFGYTWDGTAWTAVDGSGTTKTDEQLKAEKGLTGVQLEGVKNDQLNGGRTVNNLIGLEGAELNAHNSKAGNDGFDPQADREQIVFNNSTLGSYDAVGLPNEADEQLTENSGMDTVFAGTIKGDEGVDFVKKGAGSLTVGTENGKGGVKAEGSDFTLEDGSFIVQGGSDNRMRDLVFADGENEGGFGFTNGSKTKAGRILETDGDGGHVSISENAELTLSGNSALKDTQISGDGSGKLTIKSGSLSFSGEGTESTALDNVNVTVAEGASLALNGGAELSGGDVTVMGKGGTISLSDDSHLNTDGSLTLEAGSRLNLGNSSGNSAGQLNGKGTLAGGLDSALDITGEGGVFSGTLTGIRALNGIVTGGGTLRVGAGAELTLDNISTDAGHKWTVDVDGSLAVDVTAGDRVNLDITLNNGSRLNYMFNSADQIDLLKGDLKVNGQAGLTLTSDGQTLRAGRYDLGLTLARGDVEGLRLRLEGLALSHYDGVLVKGEDGLLSVELATMVNNSWMRSNQEKNAKAGAAVFWDATDPGSSSNEYIQDHPDGDLAQFANLLYWTDYNEDYAGMDRALAAGVGASAAALSPAVSRDVLRQLSMLRNRAAMADAVPTAATTSGESHFRMWMSAESGYYKLNADGLAPGFTLNGWGGSVGMDAEVRKNVVVGCSITAMYNDLKTHSADAGSGDVDTTYLSAYASVKRGAWTHSLVVTGGLVDTTLNRTVSANATMEYGIFPIAGHTYTARGETSGYALGAMYEVGYTCIMNEAGTLALQPVANVQVVHSALDGYTEGGSDAGLNVGGISQTQVTLGLGARLQGVMHESAFGRDAIFETRALAKLDAADRSGKSRNSLKNAAGMAAEVESARAGAVGIELGAGLSVPVGSAGGSIFMDASVELRNHADMVNVTAGYRLSF